jgi:hypothetical protein
VYDDLGGAGWNTATAFNRHRPEWTYRAVTGAPSYLQFPQHSPWDWPTICDWFAEADVVHLHDGYHGLPAVRNFVCTYHGTGFREQPAAFLRPQYELRATGLVSTLDLWLLAPDDVTWAPAAHDLDWYADLRAQHYPNDGVLRIGHAPTWRPGKHTDLFLEECRRLADEHPIEVVLIEGKSWKETLALKATVDVFYDQLMHGYGGNAIEAWGMGVPVICGAQDATLEEYLRRFGTLPFMLADPSTLGTALRRILDPATRQLYAGIGRTHAQRFHSYPAVVDRLEPIYLAAAGA